MPVSPCVAGRDVGAKIWAASHTFHASTPQTLCRTEVSSPRCRALHVRACWTARKSCSVLGALDRGTPRQLLKLVPLKCPAGCSMGAHAGRGGVHVNTGSSQSKSGLQRLCSLSYRMCRGRTLDGSEVYGIWYIFSIKRLCAAGCDVGAHAGRRGVHAGTGGPQRYARQRLRQCHHPGGTFNDSVFFCMIIVSA